MPVAMSVCMFAERCFSAAHAPVKNCDPDHSSTARVTMAMPPQIRFSAVDPFSGMPGNSSGYEKYITGTEMTAANQNFLSSVR